MVESVVLIYFTQNIKGSLFQQFLKIFTLFIHFVAILTELLTWKRSKIKKEKNQVNVYQYFTLYNKIVRFTNECEVSSKVF